MEYRLEYLVEVSLCISIKQITIIFYYNDMRIIKLNTRKQKFLQITKERMHDGEHWNNGEV